MPPQYLPILIVVLLITSIILAGSVIGIWRLLYVAAQQRAVIRRQRNEIDEANELIKSQRRLLSEAWERETVLLGRKMSGLDDHQIRTAGEETMRNKIVTALSTAVDEFTCAQCAMIGGIHAIGCPLNLSGDSAPINPSEVK